MGKTGPEFEYSKRFGHLWWKIQSGYNRWGWYLKLISVEIKGVLYSIFVLAMNVANPNWRNFVNAFVQVAQEELKQHAVVGVTQKVYLLESFVMLGRKTSSFSHDSKLKLKVDALLKWENLQIGSNSELKVKGGYVKE